MPDRAHDQATATTAVASRTRYARGEGNRLRDDILDAARRLLERGETAEDVTLRAVAREVGIAAPSIYRHFADREAILRAVVEATYRELEAAIVAARDTEDDPVERLVAGCLGYVHFGLDHPGRYRILFNQLGTDMASGPPYDPDCIIGLESFQLLIDGVADCRTVGRSTSEEPEVDAVNIWTGLHGVVTLRSTAPAFPWPPLEPMVASLVTTLGRTN